MRITYAGQKAALDGLNSEFRFALLIAGGARGADTLAVEWAGERGIAVQVLHGGMGAAWPQGRATAIAGRLNIGRASVYRVLAS
jgi:hypothetical protein